MHQECKAGQRVHRRKLPGQHALAFVQNQRQPGSKETNKRKIRRNKRNKVNWHTGTGCVEKRGGGGGGAVFMTMETTENNCAVAHL